MKPLVFCAFPPCWCADVCRFVSKMTKQLLVLDGEQKAGRSKGSQSPVCVLTPPSDLYVDSSKPLGSTTWTDPQLRASTAIPLQFQVFHTRTGKKATDRFLAAILWVFLRCSDTLGGILKVSRFFSDRVFHLVQSVQTEVQVQRADVGLCFNAMIASLLVSHRFKWTNAELYTAEVSWYWQ